MAPLAVTNWNSGVVPVGPPVNLLGSIRGILADAEPGLVPILAPWEAVSAAARFAWTIFLVSREDPVVILVDKLRPEIEAKKCADVPPQMTFEEMSIILRDAQRGERNFGLGSATRADAELLGEAWVGAEARQSESDVNILISKDGLRQYRSPSEKPNSSQATTGGVQANFESRDVPGGKWIRNGHLDILP